MASISVNQDGMECSYRHLNKDRMVCILSFAHKFHFPMPFNGRAILDINVNIFALFLEALYAREIRLEKISKFSNGIIEGRDQRNSQLMTSKDKRIGDRFNDSNVFLKSIYQIHDKV